MVLESASTFDIWLKMQYKIVNSDAKQKWGNLFHAGI